MTPVEGQQGAFSVVVHLPPGYAGWFLVLEWVWRPHAGEIKSRQGLVWLPMLTCSSSSACHSHRRYHQYKFIVDGEWRHDETQPFMPDPLGNVNNWLFVRKPETGSGPAPVQPTAVTAAPAPQPSSPLAQPSSPAPQPASPAHSAAPAPGAKAFAEPAAATNAAPASAPAARAPQQPLPESRSAAGSQAPPSVRSEAEPENTCRSVQDFLGAHTAYELIPESGKVVVLDVDLPMRQALHALHEQGKRVVHQEGGGEKGDYVCTLFLY